jgi:cyclopropane-fatty-acyl-phospholipid synthase
MGLLTLEHSKGAYRADFALHGIAVVGLVGWLIGESPRDQWLELMCVTLIGLLGWTVVEYALHRFLLHGVRPFRDWHAQHHQRPKALIYAPTVLIALCFAVGVALPAWVLFNEWVACALTLGLLTGYLAYSVTHHATHHWRGDGLWLKRRKRWHALHHHQSTPAFYGVTTQLWDHVFRTQGRSRTVDSNASWRACVIGASPPARAAD